MGSSWNGWKVALISHSAPPISSSASSASTRRPPRPRAAPAGRPGLERGGGGRRAPRGSGRLGPRGGTGRVRAAVMVRRGTAPAPRPRPTPGGTPAWPAARRRARRGRTGPPACRAPRLAPRRAPRTRSHPTRRRVRARARRLDLGRGRLRRRRPLDVEVLGRLRLRGSRAAAEERLRRWGGLAAAGGALGGCPGAFLRTSLRGCRVAARHVLPRHCGGPGRRTRRDPSLSGQRSLAVSSSETGSPLSSRTSVSSPSTATIRPCECM